MWSVLVSVVLCCVAQSSGDGSRSRSLTRTSPDCAWFRLGSINNDIISLLDNMGPPAPGQCVESRFVHLFPVEIFSDAEDLVPLLILQTVQQFSKVFSGDLSSVSWNQEKVQLLRNYVFRQTKRLQQCVDQGVLTDVVTTATALAPFSDQLTILQTQEECGWELIRSKFQFAFSQFKTFLDNKTHPTSK